MCGKKSGFITGSSTIKAYFVVRALRLFDRQGQQTTQIERTDLLCKIKINWTYAILPDRKFDVNAVEQRGPAIFHRGESFKHMLFSLFISVSEIFV